MILTLRLAAVSLAAMTLSSAFALWNYAEDFSVGNGNPNSVWTYGVKGSDSPTGNFLAFPDHGSNSTWLYWIDNAHQLLGAPAATKNIGSTSINGIAPGEGNMHPGPNGEVVTVRWTAPTSGVFRIFGVFGVGDGGAIDAFVGTPTSLILEHRATFDSVGFDFTRSLNAGDSIDFGVGSAGSFYYDSTPLHASIEAVPEPLTLLGLGVGFALMARRRR